MPDVGILNLQVNDNSAKAAQGIDTLADALTRVKKAVGTKFDLSALASSLTKIKNALNGNWGDTSKFENLQKLRDAANSLARGNTAAKITQVAKSMKDYATNLDSTASALQHVRREAELYFSLQQSYKGGGVVDKILTEEDQVSTRPGMMKLNLQQFGGKTGNVQSQLADLGKTIQGIQDLSVALGNLKKNTGDNIKLGNIPSQINKLREALTGNWGTGTKFDNMGKLKDAVNALARNKIGEKLKAVAAGLRSYGNALGKIPSNANLKGLNLENIMGGGGKPTANENIAENVRNVGDAMEDLTDRDIDTSEITTLTENIQLYEDILSDLREKQDQMLESREKDPASFSKLSYDRLRASIQKTSDTIGKLRAKMKFGALREVDEEVAKLADGFIKTGKSVEFLEARMLELRVKIGQGLKGTQSLGTLENWRKEYEKLSKEYEELTKSAQDAGKTDQSVNEGLRDVGRTAQEAGEAVADAVHRVRGELDPESQRLKDMNKDLFDVNGNMKNLKETTGDWMPGPPTDLSKNSILANALLAEDPKAIGIEMDRSDRTWEEVTDQIHKYKGALEELRMENLNDILNYTPVQLLTAKLEAMNVALREGVKNNRLTNQQMIEKTIQIQRVESQLDKLKAKEQAATESTKHLRDAFEELKSNIKDLGISKLLKQFLRMAKMRAMRYVIREISKGFSEGIQNVYQYSKAINGAFFKSMDEAASALLQMKNAVGAAAAPLIQMLIPYLQQLTNAFIQVVNWANQFFALLNGQQTWTHAVPATAEAFNDQAHAAHNAANAVKDLLADWDELNIIQSQTGGGSTNGAQSTAEDYLNMFEEVAEFENLIKDITDFLKENLENIKRIAIDIGAAFLAWKIGGLLTGLQQAMGFLATLGIVDMTFQATMAFDKEYLRTGNAGWLLANVLTTLVGAVWADHVFESVKLGGVGRVIVPLVFFVSAMADILTLIGDVNTGMFTKEGLTLAVLSALKAGVAGGLLAYRFSWFGGGKAAAIGGGLATALVTLGAVVGLKTIVAAFTSGVTMDTLKGTALSSLALGVGTAMFAKLMGASALAALGAGGLAAGLAIVTIAAAIGIHALLVAEKKNIEWGSFNMTEEQIQAYVQEKMFTVDVATIVNLVNAKVQASESTKTSIRTQAQGLLTQMNIIKLGLATQDTYDNIKTALFGDDQGNGGVIQQIKDYAKDQKNVLETSFTIAPIVDKNGNTDKKATAEFLKAGLTGWDEVEKYMTTIGNDLAKALETGTTSGLDGYDDELILKLTGELQNVQAAITQAQTGAALTSALLSGMNAMDEPTARAVMELFDAEQEKMRTSIEQALQEELSSYQSLAAFYRARGYKGDSDKADKLDELAKNLIDNWSNRVEAAVRNASEPGRKIIGEALAQLVEIGPDDIKEHLKSSDNSRGLFNQITDDIFRNADNIDNPETQRNVKGRLYDFLLATIGDVYGEDADLIVDALSKHYMELGDVFSMEAINGIVAAFKNNSQYGGIVERMLYETIFPNNVFIRAGKEARDAAAERAEMMLNSVRDGIRDVLEAASRSNELGEEVGQSFEINIDVITAEAKNGMNEIEETVQEPVEAAPIDDREWKRKLGEMIQYSKRAADTIRYNLYDGGLISGGTWAPFHGNSDASGHLPVNRGTPVLSGDLIMQGAKLSLNKGGTQTGNDANVVGGIRQGVSGANEDMVSELRTMTTLMQRMLATGLTAKVVPSAQMGRNNVKSAEAYSKVTGQLI